MTSEIHIFNTADNVLENNAITMRSDALSNISTARPIAFIHEDELCIMTTDKYRALFVDLYSKMVVNVVNKYYYTQYTNGGYLVEVGSAKFVFGSEDGGEYVKVIDPKYSTIRNISVEYYNSEISENSSADLVDNYIYFMNDERISRISLSFIIKPAKYTPSIVNKNNYTSLTEFNIIAKKFANEVDKAEVEKNIVEYFDAYVDPLLPGEITDGTTYINGVRGAFTITELNADTIEINPLHTDIIAIINRNKSRFKAYNVHLDASVITRMYYRPMSLGDMSSPGGDDIRYHRFSNS